MSMIEDYTVQCDHCENIAGWQPIKRLAREAAIAAGWVRRSDISGVSFDICPNCNGEQRTRGNPIPIDALLVIEEIAPLIAHNKLGDPAAWMKAWEQVSPWLAALNPDKPTATTTKVTIQYAPGVTPSGTAAESLLDSTGPKIDESGRMMWGGHDVVESMRYNLPLDYRDLAYRTANRGGDVGALIDVAGQAQNELDKARQRIAELEAQIKREDDLWVLLNNGETLQLRFVRRTVSPTKEHPVSAKLGKTIVRPEFPVNPADYE